MKFAQPSSKAGIYNISSCCMGKRKTADGFIFKHKNGGRWNAISSAS